MPAAASPTPAGRDRAVRRLRVATWSLGATAAALSVALSAVAAHAFKGRDGRVRPAAARVRVRVRVPPPQHVPRIAGVPAPLRPPAAPPVVPQPQPPQPQPETSGGS